MTRPTTPVARKCVVCGQPFYGYGHRLLCGDPDCERTRRNGHFRAFYWRHAHGTEPPPMSARQQTCSVCGKPLDQEVGVPIKVCSRWCSQERERQRSRETYTRKRQREAAHA